MTTCYLAPDPIQSTQFIPGGNTPANGGQLFFYVAGSSTKQTVYKDNAAAVAWTNPIVLDSGGNLPSGGEVWFPTGQTFKVIFAPSTDTDPPASPYWTKDNLSGINDVGTQTGTEWVSGPAPTYISGTQFVLSGDQSATFTAGRRLKTTNTGGTIYSTIQNAVFSAASTTVNVVSDSGSLDSGLSAVSYGIADPANPSISPYEINRKGTAVASAGNGTTNIWGTVGDYVHVTGTNTIWNFSTAPYAGAIRELIFDGVLSINSSAAITINGGNATTAANDRAKVRADTVSTHILDFVVNSGKVLPAARATSTQIKTGTVTDQVMTPGDFAAFKTVSSVGYYTFPAGLMVQWGSTATVTSGATTVTYATTFPTSVFSIALAGQSVTQGAAPQLSGSPGSSTFAVSLATDTGNIAGTVYYIAIGH